MSNHLPNDLSHLSDAEFYSLCPQGEHAPGPQPLSPAAQAVLDAFLVDAENTGLQMDDMRENVAAALRAAADEVAPMSYEDIWTDGRVLQYERQDPVRDKLLAIADELEGQ